MPKTQQQKRATLRRKADKLLQETIRALYDTCLICGKPISCGHHYYPKSTCSALRYNIKNIVPVCQGCHFSHHNGNPEIHNTVNEIWGEEKLYELKSIKRNSFVKESLEYYNNIIENLKKIGG